MISALLTICNKIWQTGEWPIPWTQSLLIMLPKKRQFAAMSELSYDYKPPKQSHAKDLIKQAEAAGRGNRI